MAARNRLAPTPPPPSDARQILTTVLLDRIERAYMTMGSAGGRRVVQDILGHFNAGSLCAAVHELGLDKELDRELVGMGVDTSRFVASR
jgi:hypothetical protein